MAFIVLNKCGVYFSTYFRTTIHAVSAASCVRHAPTSVESSDIESFSHSSKTNLFQVDGESLNIHFQVLS